MGFLKTVAVDLDGTLTTGGAVPAEVRAVFSTLRSDNVRSLLVTGRTRAALDREFPGLTSAFDVVIAENGAVIASRNGSRLLAPPIDPAVKQALSGRGIAVDSGEVLLACDGAQAAAVAEEVGRLGLDSQVIHNRAALMILPAGVSKGTGLRAGLAELGLSAHNTLAVGDAENDLALLDVAEVGVAVSNAVPSLKAHADLVLQEPGKSGIIGLLTGPLLTGAEPFCPARRWVRIGDFDDRSPALVPGCQANILVAGPSGDGKSYVAGLLAEAWILADYRVLVIDPEGDHSGLAQLRDTFVVGVDTPLPAPVTLVNDLLVSSVVVDMSQLSMNEKTRYGRQVLEAADLARTDRGLPHWIVIDEAHLLVPDPNFVGQLQRLAGRGEVLVTYQSESLPEQVGALVDIAISVTKSTASYGEFSVPTPRATLALDGRHRDFTAAVRRTHHARHRRKYVNTELAQHQRFYFHPVEGGTPAPSAANLTEFVSQLAGVDRETLDYHLARGDFSRWINGTLQDVKLARHVAVIEHDARAAQALNAEHARQRLADAISARYFVTPKKALDAVIDLTADPAGRAAEHPSPRRH